MLSSMLLHAPLASHPPSNCTGQVPLSARGLPKSCRADRSTAENLEAASDDHDAIHDASKATSQASSDTTTSEFDKDNVVSTPPGDLFSSFRDLSTAQAQDGITGGVRFRNKPDGTPLFTIIEQQSLATLRSKGSSLKFAISPHKTTISAAQAHLRLILRKADGARSASADDIAFADLRKAQESLKAYRNQQKEDNSSEETNIALQAAPVLPLFQPPERIPTPAGAPRWPNDLTSEPYNNQAATRPAPSGARFGLSRLRSTVSRLFGSDEEQQAPIRPWRPAPSGHYTLRYGDMNDHPFSNAPVADFVPPLSRTFPTNDVAGHVSSTPRSSTLRRSRSQSSAISAALRALSEVQGHAIPVNPARALSPGMPRSVALPSGQRVISQTSTLPYTSDTMRTMDIIDQFPLPPSSPRIAADDEQSTKSVMASPSPRRSFPARTPLLIFPQREDLTRRQDSDSAEARRDSACYIDHDSHGTASAVSADTMHPAAPPQLPQTPQYTESHMSGGLPILHDRMSHQSGHSRELSHIIYSTHTNWGELCPHLIARAKREERSSKSSRPGTRRLSKKASIRTLDVASLKTLATRMLPTRKSKKKTMCLKCKAEAKLKHGVDRVAKSLAGLYMAGVSMP